MGRPGGRAAHSGLILLGEFALHRGPACGRGCDHFGGICQEGGGAVIGGLRYGEGVLYTKNAGDLRVYWQGPTLGWDFGGEGARTMMLVYNLPATRAV